MSLIAPDGTPVAAPPIRPAALPDPKMRLPQAFRDFMMAARESRTSVAVAALDECLQALAEIHRGQEPEFSPALHVDYTIPVEGTQIGVKSHTPLGERLCQLWQSYTTECENAALREQVVRLIHAVNDLSTRLDAQQRQIDNAMLDFNAMKRKIRA